MQIKCIHCNSGQYVKKGFRKTKNRGSIQMYDCKTCNKRFTNDEGFYRMRNSPEKITEPVDLYFSALSSRKIKNYLGRHHRNSSHITILNWARKYSLKAQKYINTLQPELSGRFYADETEIDRARKDRKNDIFWCSIDWRTRYINVTLYSPHKQNLKDGKTFLEKIKSSKNKSKYVTTDGLPLYPRLMRKVFSTNKNKPFRTKHFVISHSKTKKHNVRIETVFSKIKDRTRNFRGLKQLWSAPILMNGIIIQHNFIENHTTTGEVPAERTGIKQDEENNRWLNLIKRSSQI